MIPSAETIRKKLIAKESARDGYVTPERQPKDLLDKIEDLKKMLAEAKEDERKQIEQAAQGN